MAVASSPVIGGAAACGGSTSADSEPLQESRDADVMLPSAVADETTPRSAEDALEREVREALRRAIAADPTLTRRQISFTVEDGDITVTGTVHSEDERRKINELAMSVPGVTSIANALEVSAK